MNRKISAYKTTLDQANAYWMSILSREAYVKKSDTDQAPDEARILSTLKAEDDGFISVFGVDKNSAQAILVEHQDYLCMAFRGTNEIADWLDNINAFATEELFGAFHRGFWNSTEDVWAPIFAKYQSLNSARKRPLFITGHSLGGAMATVAAAKLIHLDLPFTSIYTFGQPRVMTRDTSRIYNMECMNRHFRFHNNNDLVTRVPARMMGYSHVGSYLYISQENTISEEPGYWFRFLDYVDGAVASVTEKGIDGITDHAIGNYINAVKAWQFEA